MALGVKGWVGLTLGFCVLLAVWLLPPREWFGGMGEWRSPRGWHLPEVRRAQEVNDVVQGVDALRQQRAFLDSLAPLVASEADGIYLDPDHLPPEELEAMEAHLREVLRDRPDGGTRVAVGVFRVPNGWGSLIRYNGTSFPSLLVGEVEGRAFCMVVDADHRPEGSPVSPRLVMDRVERGPCALYARYGVPGPRIRAWLRETLHRDARNAAELIREPGVEPPEHRRGLFGMRASSARIGDLPPTGERCLAGDVAACEAAVLEAPETGSTWTDERSSTQRWIQEELGTDYVSLRWSVNYEPLGDQQAGLLFAVEEAFGPEAFARFWRSDEDVPRAFEAAFGQPLGQWTMAWARSWRGGLRPGPGVPLSTAGLSLLAVALCGAVAVGFGLRRRVG